MSEPRPIAISYGMLLVAIAAVAGLSAMVFVLKPKGAIESTPPPTEAPPPPAPVVAAKPSSSGPIAFRDPENTKRYLALQTTVASFRKKLTVMSDQMTMPADDLETTCSEIAALANPLAGEPHPEVLKVADDAKRACDYDRPLTAIRLAVKLLKVKGAAKKDICAIAGRSTAVLMEKKYGDDEKVKAELAELGKACM